MKIFLSHSSQDDVFVSKLTNDLTQAGCEVWKAPEGVSLGDQWVAVLQDELKNSDCFLLVLSQAALESKWVKMEMNTAIRLAVEHEKMKIIPLDYQPHGELHVFWDNYQRINFRSNYAKALDQLLRELGADRARTVTTTKGDFKIPGNAYMDGRDFEAVPTLTVMNINLWDNVPRRKRVGSVEHGARIEILQDLFYEEEGRYYFLVNSPEYRGWVSEPFLSPNFNQPIGDEIE